MEKGQYKTKHREELLEYLKTVPGKHVTVNDICFYLKKEGKDIGTTTVYRQLEKLVDEGVVNKYLLDANTPACFEYIDAGKHCHEHKCFHCKCIKCGKLIHLHCDELEAIGSHIFEEHSFKVDTQRTVLYGVCEECNQEG